MPYLPTDPNEQLLRCKFVLGLTILQLMTRLEHRGQVKFADRVRVGALYLSVWTGVMMLPGAVL